MRISDWSSDVCSSDLPRYDGRALLLSKEEVARRLAAGEPHVIRMKVPTEGVCVVPDMLRGAVEIPWERMDLPVLTTTDGLPTYFVADVVGGQLMGITHFLRGEEDRKRVCWGKSVAE